MLSSAESHTYARANWYDPAWLTYQAESWPYSAGQEFGAPAAKSGDISGASHPGWTLFSAHSV